MIGNYWLVIIAWCLFLNDYVFLSEVVLVISSLSLFLNKKMHNRFRVVINSFLTYIIVKTILTLSNIPYFFPEMSIHLLLVSIQCSMMYEYYDRLNDNFILPVIVIMILNMIFTVALIIIIPDEFYSLIGKTSLLIITCFIFLPHLSPLMMCYVSRVHRRKSSYMQNKELQL